RSSRGYRHPASGRRWKHAGWLRNDQVLRATEVKVVAAPLGACRGHPDNWALYHAHRDCRDKPGDDATTLAPLTAAVTHLIRLHECCRADTPLASFVGHVEKPTDNMRRDGRLFRRKPGPGWGVPEARDRCEP